MHVGRALAYRIVPAGIRRAGGSTAAEAAPALTYRRLALALAGASAVQGGVILVSLNVPEAAESAGIPGIPAALSFPLIPAALSFGGGLVAFRAGCAPARPRWFWYPSLALTQVVGSTSAALFQYWLHRPPTPLEPDDERACLERIVALGITRLIDPQTGVPIHDALIAWREIFDLLSADDAPGGGEKPAPHRPPPPTRHITPASLRAAALGATERLGADTLAAAPERRHAALLRATGVAPVLLDLAAADEQLAARVLRAADLDGDGRVTFRDFALFLVELQGIAEASAPASAAALARLLVPPAAAGGERAASAASAADELRYWARTLGAFGGFDDSEDALVVDAFGRARRATAAEIADQLLAEYTGTSGARRARAAGLRAADIGGPDAYAGTGSRAGDDQPPFVPALTFKGARDGYVYRRGNFGPGYYAAEPAAPAGAGGDALAPAGETAERRRARERANARLVAAFRKALGACEKAYVSSTPVTPVDMAIAVVHYQLVTDPETMRQNDQDHPPPGSRTSAFGYSSNLK